MVTTVDQKVTFADVATAYARVTAELTLLQQEMVRVEYAYRQTKARVELEIYSNKDYLHTCSFSHMLPKPIATLSNPELRGSALTTALGLEPDLSVAFTAYRELSSKISTLQNVQMSLGMLASLGQHNPQFALDVEELPTLLLGHL